MGSKGMYPRSWVGAPAYMYVELHAREIDVDMVCMLVEVTELQSERSTSSRGLSSDHDVGVIKWRHVK